MLWSHYRLGVLAVALLRRALERPTHPPPAALQTAVSPEPYWRGRPYGRPNPIARRDSRAHEADSRHYIVDEVVRVGTKSVWHVQRSKPDLLTAFFLNHSEPQYRAWPTAAPPE